MFSIVGGYVPRWLCVGGGVVTGGLALGWRWVGAACFVYCVCLGEGGVGGVWRWFVIVLRCVLFDVAC